MTTTTTTADDVCPRCLAVAADMAPWAEAPWTHLCFACRRQIVLSPSGFAHVTSIHMHHPGGIVVLPREDAAATIHALRQTRTGPRPKKNTKGGRERELILSMLAHASELLTAADIADLTDIPIGSVRLALHALANANLILVGAPLAAPTGPPWKRYRSKP